MKVLVTGAGALLGQGIIRSLRKSTLDVTIVAVDPSPESVGLYWADSAHLVPLADDPGFMDRIREILAAEHPDAVLIGTDVELRPFSHSRRELESDFGTRVVVSDERVISIADDKYETFRFFKKEGLPHPDSCLPGEESSLIDRVGFPLVVKPRVGARSMGVHVVTNRDELARHLSTVPGAMIQELAGDADQEYTAGTLCFQGRAHSSIVMQRELRDGNTYRARVTENRELNRAVEGFAERLGAHGPTNFQFRLKGGQVRVFEINARFSGTTPLRTLAGFNEVEIALRRDVLGEDVAPPLVAPMKFLRYWDEVALSPDDGIRLS